MGKTIIISSHILHELAELCTTVGIIERGELLFHGSLDEIIRRTQTGTLVEIKVGEHQERASAILAQLEEVSEVLSDNGRLLVSLKRDTDEFSFLAKALVDAKLPIKEIKKEEVNLETAFMRFTKGIVQ